MTKGSVRASQFARNTVGWTALAAALSLMAIPVAANAQDRNGGSRGNQQSQQSNQNRGEAYRMRGSQTRSEPTRSQPTRTQSAPQQTRQQAAPSSSSQGRGPGSHRPARNQPVARNQQCPAQRRQSQQQQQQRPPRLTWRNSDQHRDNSARDNNWRGSNDQRRDNNSRNIDQRRDNNWNGNNDRRDSTTRYRNGESRQWSNNDNRRWDRNWRSNNRYDWQDYRTSHRNAYRIGRYSAPYSNYSYRRLGIGFRLGNLFYSNRYWIDDPWQYRLPEVYGPYRWVRYYDDVLLVNVYTGEVVDAIQDFFW